MRQAGVFMLLGVVVSPFTDIIKTYVFSDFHYLIYLFVIASVDTLLGVVKALKQKNFSSIGWGMVINKIIVYGAALITSHTLVSFTIHDKSSGAFSWFDTAVFSALMSREAISIFENIAAIIPNAFPPGILKYLKDFDSLTGKQKIEK